MSMCDSKLFSCNWKMWSRAFSSLHWPHVKPVKLVWPRQGSTNEEPGPWALGLYVVDKILGCVHSEHVSLKLASFSVSSSNMCLVVTGAAACSLPSGSLIIVCESQCHILLYLLVLLTCFTAPVDALALANMAIDWGRPSRDFELGPCLTCILAPSISAIEGNSSAHERS